MNEADDPLEIELAALRPHAASSELRRRIAARLNHSAAVRWRWAWGLGAAAGLAAACLLVMLLVRRGEPGGVDPVRTAVVAPPTDLDAAGESLPTLQAYQRALDRSPEALDALLDRHAARGARFNSPAADFHVEARFGRPLQSWSGEY